MKCDDTWADMKKAGRQSRSKVVGDYECEIQI
jgi:hypothetical protein